MKFIDNKVYIAFKDFIDAGFLEDTIKKANFRNGPFWMMIDNPDDKRMPLVEFDSLRCKHKKQLEKRFGNVLDHVLTQPIRNMIEHDQAAEDWFTTYRQDGKSLSPDHIRSFTKAANWLNLLIRLNDNKKAIKKELGFKLITDFWDKVEQIIKTDNISIPSCYRRIREKMKEYSEVGYSCLVDGRLGNSNGVKVPDELSLSVLLEMVADPNQHDDVWIMLHYNAWAKKNGYESITDATVGNYRRKHYATLVMQREGREAYYNQYSKSIKGYRPTTPLYLVESDDNHLDFFFVDWDDKTGHKFYNKFKAIVVTDSYNDYVLGYAYAQELTADVVRQAYANAIHHIKEITGQYYLPRETKTDRWAIGELEPFYKSLGNYFKTPVGSKRRGFIEQFFGSKHWKRCAKYGTNNYSGNNITALNDGVNKEVLKANRHNYPTVAEAGTHIEDFFARLRLMPQTGTSAGISKQQQWLDAFHKTDAAKLKPISEEVFLLKLGMLRMKAGTKVPEQNTITSRGLDISINKRKYNFDIPDEYYFNYKGCEVETIYDPNDLSRVLVTDHKRLRFIARQPVLQPRALADYQPGDRLALNNHLEAKQKHVEQVTDQQANRKAILTRSGIDVTALLTSGNFIKEDKQKAELEYERQEMEYLEPPPSKRRSSPLDKM